jgi:predicted transcriptional regulator
MTPAQAPIIKVNTQTKERIRLLAAMTDLTHGEVVDRAVTEYVARHPDVIAKGIAHARSVLETGDDIALAADLLDVPYEDIARVAGPSR